MSGRVAYSVSPVGSRSMFAFRIIFSGRGVSGQSRRIVLSHICDVILCEVLTRVAENVFLYMLSKGRARRHHHCCQK
jgi:hypothetical protein